MNESHDNITSPMTYLKVFFRRKELLIIPAFTGLILGICAGLILPKQYRSSTVILIEEGKTDNPLFSHLAVATNIGQRMSTIKESMLGWHSLVELVRRLQMDKDVKTPEEFEKLILDIRQKISIRLKGRNIIKLAFIGDDPVLTRDVVKTITDIFIKRNVDIQNANTSDAIMFIEQQLKLYKAKIKSAQIAKMKDELKTVLADATELHPRVKQLRDQIAQKEKELKEEDLPYIETDPLSSESTNPIIQEIKTALSKLEGGKGPLPLTTPTGEPIMGKEQYKVLLMEKLNNVMARDEEVNIQIYNMLLRRLETAKITQNLQSSKEGTKYTIIDPPRVPFKPVKPNKILVALGGLFAGVMMGVALIVITEFLDKSFIDVEEATQYFGEPLLGAISKITTDASLRAEREKEYWRYGLMLVAGIVAVVLTKAVSNFLG